MDNPEEDKNFNEVVETLIGMFGEVMCKDVIFAVVENCGGDLNLAAEAIMNISDSSGHDPADINTNISTESTACNVIPDVHPTMDTPITSMNREIRNTNQPMLKPNQNEGIISDIITSSRQISDENAPSSYNTSVTTSVSNESFNASSKQTNNFKPLEINTSTTDATDNVILKAMNKENSPKDRTNPIQNQNEQKIMSYAGISRNTGAFPKQQTKHVKNEAKINWTPQLGRIIKAHNNGFRLLLLMRGVPGSGKSYLARQVIELTVGGNSINYKTHILSTDDYFSLRGTYEFNKNNLPEAHKWNQRRARQALESGLSPVIIDNTNLEMWEMETYVRPGVLNGYFIHVMEPKTPWSKKPNQLFKKNKHGVELRTIVRMLERYVENITGELLIEHYNLSYPTHNFPPVMRKIPLPSTPQYNMTERKQSANTSVQEQLIELQSNVTSTTSVKTETDYEICGSNTNASNDAVNKGVEFDKQNLYSEIEKQLEEMEKVEKEWENGEAWDEDIKENTNKNDCSEATALKNAKPPRKITENCLENAPTNYDKLLESVSSVKDWQTISMFIPSWNDDTPNSLKTPEILVEKRSASTCMEIGDTTSNIYKVMSVVSRNINEYYIVPTREKIPEKRMLDKSSMTNEGLITDAFRCKNEERHFAAFRKMFKTISKPALRDIFDQCCGDVNWAVEIVLDGKTNNLLETVDDEQLSDQEEENGEQCSCLAAYNIVPDGDMPTTKEIPINTPESHSDKAPQYQRKVKKEITDSNLQLKRDIEQNFVIGDDFYSNHCLNIRKLRHGELKCVNETDQVDTATEAVEEASNAAGYSEAMNNQVVTFDNDNEDANTTYDEHENIVNVNVGREFISLLDKLFGRKDMRYPENVEPKISLPIFLLNEINALWMESLMHQLDECDKQSALMLQQDEEFARQLAQKEMEFAQAGKEPEVPNFKEIMDMDFAISLYQKDIAEWRNKEPNDLAAKLTREKLYNLFPELPADTLSELLMAHDNNFQSTVEVLLMSTGKANILEEQNGLNKFVMLKEMERKEKIIAEEKKALSEVHWPLLPRGLKVDMNTVNNYRDEADQHLGRRNASYQKAQEFIRRGMFQVANYYSVIASFHKQKFEQANSLAAASLIQVHAADNPDNSTINLHYLRVGEARESLDLFIDMHISKLREFKEANRGPMVHTLFFITGRGLHSNGRPKIKPAVKRRLTERGIVFSERNPGLLSARVTAEDRLSYQIQLP